MGSLRLPGITSYTIPAPLLRIPPLARYRRGERLWSSRFQHSARGGQTPPPPQSERGGQTPPPRPGMQHGRRAEMPAAAGPGPRRSRSRSDTCRPADSDRSYDPKCPGGGRLAIRSAFDRQASHVVPPSVGRIRPGQDTHGNGRLVLPVGG